MKNIIIFLMLLLSSTFIYTENKPKIDSIVNKEIFIADGFSGQSITLIKEVNKFYIIRKFFGSGRPIIATLKYAVTLDSDYQIRFSKVIEGKRNDLMENIYEDFILSINDKMEIQLLLNGIQVVIKKI